MAWTSKDIAVRVHDKHADLIRTTIGETFAGVRFLGGEPDDLAALNVFIGFRPPEGERLEGYDWIHSTGAGVDHILAVLETGPTAPVITRTIGRMGEQIGEFCLGYALAHLQKMERRRALQAHANWAPAEASPDFCFDSEIAILGTGEIGQGIARIFKALGARVTGYSRSGTPKPGFDAVLEVSQIGRADVFIIALPSTPETENLVGADVLSRLEGALLINVGRGSTLDPDGLKAALAEGHVSHAVLDVVEREPLPASDWRWQHDGVTVTPHVSGQTRPQDSVAGFCRLLAAYLETGQRPASVDVVRGY